ncbi:uncharacterized protein LY89DRAFT_57757 [Mollisia scopiformis]|uniref:Uncharacterized protein n=1 Tax=Mollisia scopiformis TaxID=149040 RepID=A0A194XCV0_MOLSC|nr:uncharacterized protein LY89DRAFT_57757 [Mollisia scopiformis]KUJ17582.1 hypothetical protein LY89DRAFT_57757 [Mollisia scopiformis]
MMSNKPKNTPAYGYRRVGTRAEHRESTPLVVSPDHLEIHLNQNLENHLKNKLENPIEQFSHRDLPPPYHPRTEIATMDPTEIPAKDNHAEIATMDNTEIPAKDNRTKNPAKGNDLERGILTERSPLLSIAPLSLSLTAPLSITTSGVRVHINRSCTFLLFLLAILVGVAFLAIAACYVWKTIRGGV